ncbi:hypothetical protein M0804_000028 [Polistes exclamans]|nr:hypothetical protein M0804_000028 [Polistes exclamans]
MVLLIALIVLYTLLTTTFVNGAGLKCDAVRPDFEAQGFPLSDIPKEPISSFPALRLSTYEDDDDEEEKEKEKEEKEEEEEEEEEEE